MLMPGNVQPVFAARGTLNLTVEAVNQTVPSGEGRASECNGAAPNRATATMPRAIPAHTIPDAPVGEVTPPSEAGILAITGGPSLAFIGGAALLLLFAGAAVIARSRRKSGETID